MPDGFTSCLLSRVQSTTPIRSRRLARRRILPFAADVELLPPSLVGDVGSAPKLPFVGENNLVGNTGVVVRSLVDPSSAASLPFPSLPLSASLSKNSTKRFEKLSSPPTPLPLEPGLEPLLPPPDTTRFIPGLPALPFCNPAASLSSAVHPNTPAISCSISYLLPSVLGVVTNEMTRFVTKRLSTVPRSAGCASAAALR